MVGLTFMVSLYRYRELWWRLSEREVIRRYRGSILGWGWSLLTPLLMLAVYKFVFSTVFKASWGVHGQVGPLPFATNLFAGLIVFGLFLNALGKLWTTSAQGGHQTLICL